MAKARTEAPKLRSNISMKRAYTLPLAAGTLLLSFAAMRFGFQNSAAAKPASDTERPTLKVTLRSGKPMSFLNFKTASLDGKPVDLSHYKGRVLLVVNTASKCGFTPQYAGLEKVYTDYEAKGLTVIGFPANNFGGQEPGTNSEIGAFCKKNYGVTFPLMAKSSVKGDDQSPIFKFLTGDANPALSGEIGWNFEKFLISRDGKLVARFKSGVTPDSDELQKAVQAELAKPAPAHTPSK